MYRKMMLGFAVLLVATLAIGCNKGEIADLNTTIDSLSKENANLESDTADLRVAVKNAINLAAEQKGLFDSTALLLNDATRKIASLQSKFSQSQTQLADKQEEYDVLKATDRVEIALLTRQCDSVTADLTTAKAEIVQLKGRVASDSAKIDTMQICYDVADHNAYHRSWFQYRLGTGFWGTPFPIPAWLDTPRITSNPAVKPQLDEKKSSRRRR